MGLEFTDADPQFVAAIPGRYGETAFKGSFTIGVTSSQRGGFELRPTKFDVTVIKKEIATTANGRQRTQDAIKATVEHEDKHVADIRKWYDQNQNRALGYFKTREDAEAHKESAYKRLTDRFERAQELSQQHRPESEWKPIMDREKATSGRAPDASAVDARARQRSAEESTRRASEMEHSINTKSQ